MVNRDALFGNIVAEGCQQDFGIENFPVGDDDFASVLEHCLISLSADASRPRHQQSTQSEDPHLIEPIAI